MSFHLEEKSLETIQHSKANFFLWIFGIIEVVHSISSVSRALEADHCKSASPCISVRKRSCKKYGFQYYMYISFSFHVNISRKSSSQNKWITNLQVNGVKWVITFSWEGYNCRAHMKWWFVSDSFFPTQSDGHLEILAFVRDRGYPLISEYIAAAAAGSGHTLLLEWLLKVNILRVCLVIALMYAHTHANLSVF